MFTNKSCEMTKTLVRENSCDVSYSDVIKKLQSDAIC